jgi:hypothetical protein
MVSKYDIHSDREFFWFKMLLVLAIIIIFGYLFCTARPCY